ncbi:SMR family transporter [Paenibacillus sp. FSL W8-0186]|uniref:DMT family transporter n=1 Tax=Paenibacillus sp. FSL W8-0186 TaxID=2921709 RepID=UPI0030CB412A
MRMRVNFDYFYLVLSILFQSISSILMKFASMNLTSGNIFLLISNVYYLAALVCLVLQAVFWQLTLKKVELSIAYPLTALNTVFILTFSYIIFKEQISFYNILGVIIIMIGVAIQNLKWASK